MHFNKGEMIKYEYIDDEYSSSSDQYDWLILKECVEINLQLRRFCFITTNKSLK